MLNTSVIIVDEVVGAYTKCMKKYREVPTFKRLDMPKNLPGHELKCTASYT
jgi:hypothetical protein